MTDALPAALPPSRRYWPLALGTWLLLSAALPLLHQRTLGKPRLTTAIATQLVADHRAPTFSAATFTAKQLVQATPGTSASAPLALIGTGLLLAASLHLCLALAGVDVHRPALFAIAAWGVIGTATLELLGWIGLMVWARSHPTALPTWPVDTWMAPVDALHLGHFVTPSRSLGAALAEGVALTKAVVAGVTFVLLSRSHPTTPRWRLAGGVGGWCLLTIGVRGGLTFALDVAQERQRPTPAPVATATVIQAPRPLPLDRTPTR
jgi:hypothetical protein